jgi:NAD(P)-dependent dehydrogenase (short-subunit alcohol dehydrogenase family)
MSTWSRPGLSGRSGGRLGQRGPAGRIGAPDDIARVVYFCVSDLSMFMSGSTLLADGGDTV